MTTDPAAEPSPRALGESLAVQVADLRGQVHAINERLDQSGLHADLNLAARFEDLAQTVVGALDGAAPRGPAAPYWIGLDHDTYHAQLADLQRWADIVLSPHYGGYELRECWPRHIHAIWELSTLAAEWQRTYAGTRPDLAQALEFYDRWLPGTMRRIADITRSCLPQCVMLRGPGDWAARPGYRLYQHHAGLIPDVCQVLTGQRSCRPVALDPVRSSTVGLYAGSPAVTLSWDITWRRR